MANIPLSQRGMIETLQDTQVSGNGNTIEAPIYFKSHKFIISTVPGVNVGAVQPETSDASDDSANWAPLTSNPVTVIAGTDIVIEYTGMLKFVRARISIPISGGIIPSVTVKYQGA